MDQNIVWLNTDWYIMYKTRRSEIVLELILKSKAFNEWWRRLTLISLPMQFLSWCRSLLPEDHDVEDADDDADQHDIEDADQHDVEEVADQHDIEDADHHDPEEKCWC